jgi:hypothetical protein
MVGFSIDETPQLRERALEIAEILSLTERCLTITFSIFHDQDYQMEPAECIHMAVNRDVLCNSASNVSQTMCCSRLGTTH